MAYGGVDAVADLVAEELSDRALVFRLRLPAAVFEGAAGHQFVHERRAVDDGHLRGSSCLDRW